MKTYLLMLAVIVLAATACHAQKHSTTAIQNSIAASNEDLDRDAEAPLNMDNVGELHQSCPPDMVEIEGDYCSNLQAKCLYNVDGDGKRMPGPGNPLWSCGEYEEPTVCIGPKVHMHFCMDKYEWPNHPGEKPQDWMTWYDAKKATESVGKRLCTAHEWTMVAEGRNYHPLAYGDGYHRNHMCNIDRHYSDVTDTEEFKALGLKRIDVFQSRRPDDKMSQALRLFLEPVGSMLDCHSDYGVYDMAGNIDEWVVNEGGITSCSNPKGCDGWISGLKGGHEWHVRQNAFAMTTHHGPTFGWYETGSRACRDIN